MLPKPPSNRVLDHEDLVIDKHFDKSGKPFYLGKSNRYAPFAARAGSAMDCFFCFNIQLAEQKRLVFFLKGKEQ